MSEEGNRISLSGLIKKFWCYAASKAPEDIKRKGKRFGRRNYKIGRQ